MTGLERTARERRLRMALEKVRGAASLALRTVPVDPTFPSWLHLRRALDDLARLEKETKP